MRERLGYETELLGPSRSGGRLTPPDTTVAWWTRRLRPPAAKYVAAWRSRPSGQAPRWRRRPSHQGHRVNGGFEVGTNRVRMQAERFSPATTDTLLRRVRAPPASHPIGSYQIATGPLDPDLARRLVPEPVFSDTKNLLYYFRLSPDAVWCLEARFLYPGWHQHSAAILAAGCGRYFPSLPGRPSRRLVRQGGVPRTSAPCGRSAACTTPWGYCRARVALAT